MDDQKPNLNKKAQAISVAGKIAALVGVIAVVIMLGCFALKLAPVITQSFNDQKDTKIIIDNDAYNEAMNSWKNGEYSAAEAGFLKALEETSSQKGEDDLSTALIHRKLGALYNEMARYDDALEQLKPAYVTFKKYLDENNGETLIAKCQISIAEIHLGDFEQGYRDLTDVYDECNDKEYKVQIGQSIAQCFTEMSRYDEAAEWYDKLEVLYNEMYGDSKKGSNEQSAFWNDRALYYSDIGQSERAVECFELAEAFWMKAHNIKEQTDTTLSDYGDKELANIYINEAITLAEMNADSDKTMECARKALLICEKRLGENNAETARCYSALSSVYNTIQDKDSERRYLEKALDISLNTVGENSELTSSILNSIGNLYLFDSEYETAIDYYERSIEIRKNILSYEHLLTANTYLNISNAKNCLEDYDGAIEAGKAGVEICEKLVGENNMHTAEAYIELSRPLINTDHFDDAQLLLDKSKAICNTYCPDGSVTEAFTYQYQMKMLLRQEKYEEALSEGLVSLNIFQKIQGENHSNTANSRLYVGDVYRFLGDAENTELYYSQTVKVYEKVFSPEIVHNALDGRIKKLIALESIDTHGLDYKEIEEKVNTLTEDITNEQVKKRYAIWGYDQ